MLFSVCIPVYNTSKYIHECIESVLKQTEKDYEIVLVDDGSTDECPQICDDYTSKYPFIRVIHKQNEGLMITRRRGFKEARGDFFICLDSDDYLIDEHAFEKIKKMIIENNCDLVVYNYISGKENPLNNQVMNLFDYPDGYVFTTSQKNELYKMLLIGKGFNAIWIKCASRNIVDVDVDYYPWKQDICRGEDLFQSYPMLNNATKVGYVKSQLIQYRWTPTSISNNPKLKYYNAYRRIYLREEEYIPLWNLDDQVVKKARIRRIPMVLTVLINGYHAAKKSNQMKVWDDFIINVVNDDFFKDLFPEEYKKSINKYYWLLGHLIIGNHIGLFKKTVDLYDFYSKNIKHRK